MQYVLWGLLLDSKSRKSDSWLDPHNFPALRSAPKASSFILECPPSYDLYSRSLTRELPLSLRWFALSLNNCIHFHCPHFWQALSTLPLLSLQSLTCTALTYKSVVAWNLKEIEQWLFKNWANHFRIRDSWHAPCEVLILRHCCHGRCILLPLIFYLLCHVTVRYFTWCT